MVIASGREIMRPCATPLGTYFPEGNLVIIILAAVFNFPSHCFSHAHQSPTAATLSPTHAHLMA